MNINILVVKNKDYYLNGKRFFFNIHKFDYAKFILLKVLDNTLKIH